MGLTRGDGGSNDSLEQSAATASAGWLGTRRGERATLKTSNDRWLEELPGGLVVRLRLCDVITRVGGMDG